MSRYPRRRCPICRVQFQPTRKTQRACGTACSRKLQGLAYVGKQPPAFRAEVARRKIARKRAVEQLCHRQWPELSVREIEIFNFAVAVGYQRGYAKGCNQLKRGYQRKAA